MFSPGVNLVMGSLNFPDHAAGGRAALPPRPDPRPRPSSSCCYFFALRSYLRTLEPITDEVRASFGKLNTRLAEALDGIETVKGAAQEQG